MRWLALSGAVILLTVYFVRAFDARNQRDLAPEHRIRFVHEFDAADEERTNWPSYLGLEDALARELELTLATVDRPASLVDRFSSGSLTSPANHPTDWNRSYEIPAASPRGAAVLLHGLTDSPYTMRSTARALAAAGFDIVVPRMPGHGFAVGGLLEARWEDWAGAARIAIRHAVSRRRAGEPLVLVGYSNGALLALDYALRCEKSALPCPAALVFLSPAIDVSAFAVVAKWHAAVSWLPFFEKFAWLEILPEIEPFKFTSFPKHAGSELYELADNTRARLEQAGLGAELPPVLAFQSVVDNTVSAEAIVTELYDRLPANGSELVVYDINRNSTLLHLLERPPAEVVAYFVDGAPWRFDVTILTNRNPSALELDALRLDAGESIPAARHTDLRWPSEIYSLSHVAVPFRADDPVYGDGAARDDSEPYGIALGALAPRGESGVLQLSADYFLRARHNPFYAFQERHLIEWLDRRLAP